MMWFSTSPITPTKSSRRPYKPRKNGLANRQKVLDSLTTAKSTREIANILGIHISNVRKHVKILETTGEIFSFGEKRNITYVRKEK